MKTSEQCYNGWARQALGWLKVWNEKEQSEKVFHMIEICGACVAELDRGHKKEPTQIVQSFLWEQGFLRKETSYERYLASGYFKEKYRKIA